MTKPKIFSFSLLNKIVLDDFFTMPCEIRIPFFVFLKKLGTLGPKAKYGVRSQKFIWTPVYRADSLRPRNSPPPAFGPIYCTMALLISQDRRHLFVTP
jgi:hypothetical protein